jgi:hypothetical protein
MARREAHHPRIVQGHLDQPSSGGSSIVCAGSTSGTLRCVQRSDVGSLSSRRRGDRARSSMPRRGARGAGSRTRQRLEPPLCRPLARRRAVNRHLRYAFTQGACPARALNSLPGAVSTRRTVQLLTSDDHTLTTVVSTRSASDRLEAPRADALVDCSDRRVRGCLDSPAVTRSGL